MFYRFGRVVIRCFCAVVFRIHVASLTALPAVGPLIICGKHISLFDPLFYIARLRYEIYSLAKITLFKFKPFGALLRWMHAIPVSRNGISTGISAVEVSARLLGEGHVMVISPEGTRVHRNTDLPARTGAVVLAHLTGAPILVCGSYIKNYRLHIFGRVDLRLGELIHYEDLCDPEAPEDYHFAAAALMERIRRYSEPDVSSYGFEKGIRYEDASAYTDC